MAVLIVLGVVGYGNSLGNRALFHHVPDTIRDPVLDNTMLRSPRLFPKIFTSEFMAATYGAYRPLGYALFALFNRVLPPDVYWPWHVVLVAIHLVTAGVIFALLRMLVKDVISAGLAGAYLVHPMFVPLANDINSIYLLWAFLFSAGTVWLYLVHLRTGNGWYLLLSTIAFAASVLTYEYTLVVAVFLMAVCLLQKDHPQGTVALLIYLLLGAYLSGLLNQSAWTTLWRLALLVVVVAVALKATKDKCWALARTLPPYVVVMGLFALVWATIKPLPLHVEFLELVRKEQLDVPFQAWFVGLVTLWGSRANIISLAMAALLPAVLLLKGRVRTVAVAVAVVVLLFATVRWNSIYRDDVTYWAKVNEVRAEPPTLEVHLATACLAQQKWESARDILFKFVLAPDTSPEFAFMVRMKLGRAFAGLGNDKVAGYFFFGIPGYKGTWYTDTFKNCLMERADFFFHAGYLSYAEHDWACGQVIDPYDVRLLTNLGKVLMYKNAFRAAAKFLRHALYLEPTNPTALYYLAFVSRVLGQDREYEHYVRQWQAATGTAGEIDFQPIYDGFSFDRDQMRAWFSSDPVKMAIDCRPARGDRRNLYWVENRGIIYNFWEVPLEIGEYFIRYKNYAKAAEFLVVAHQTNPRSREVIQRLAQTYRQLNELELASRFERMLEKIPDETQPE